MCNRAAWDQLLHKLHRGDQQDNCKASELALYPPKRSEVSNSCQVKPLQHSSYDDTCDIQHFDNISQGHRWRGARWRGPRRQFSD